MARLTQSQCIELIKKPKNATFLAQAVEEEQRLLFHCEPILNAKSLPPEAKRRFIDWVKSFLPDDKHTRFEQMLTLPIDTVESTKCIFDELNKFLDAQDRFVKFDFNSENISKDFNDYTSYLKDADFWRTKAMEALRTGINSYLVVDMPQTQKALRPDPYYYFVSVSDVVDTDINELNDRLEYFIYRITERKFVVIDDEFYRVVVLTDGGVYEFPTENPHSIFGSNGDVIDGLGYTPVVDFYSKCIKNTGRIVKRGPLTNSLGKLDWLLYFRTSKKHLDLYAAWPIIVAYTQKCHYKDDKGAECIDGYVTTDKFDGEKLVPTTLRCPSCSKRNMIGAGTYFEVQPPQDADAFDMMANPLKIIEAPDKTLAWIVGEIERLEDEIYTACVGYDGDAMSKEAVNENQVSANFESKESILDAIKEEFERAHKFVMDTVCRLRYGNLFVGSTVDYGTDYFLKSAEELTNEYKLAKDAGMPVAYTASLRQQTISTKFKNNPEQLARLQIMQDLEPYADMAIANLVAAGIRDIDPINYILKLNFTTFISRFERENANIVIFGSLADYNSKISTIKKTLETYAREQLKQAPKPQNDGGTNAGPQN